MIDRRGGCRLSFEPVADLARGTICGYEAISRFPEAIGPEEWRVEATRRGLEPDLDLFVIGSVLKAREGLPPNCFLSFNIYSPTLLREPVQRLLASVGSLEGLVVELCPRVEPVDAERLGAAVAKLRAAGASIALDGVGGDAGVLGYVSIVRPDFVKLDARLVSGLHEDDAKRVLLEGIGEIANRFDAWVVAQGVEQIKELDALMAMRVPLAQGPLIGVGAKTLTRVAFVLSAYVRERGAELAAPGALVGLLEHPPEVEHDDDPRVVSIVLSATFGASRGVRFVPLLDGRGRPVGLAERCSHERGEPPSEELLVVSLAARVPDVARRAMARPAAIRFHPLVCCDERGAYIGLVSVERLVMALAAARSPEPVPGG